MLLFTYIYNKVYIKNNQRDFLVFFFGEKGGDDFSRVGGNLVVVAYWFLIYYSNYKTFSAKLTESTEKTFKRTQRLLRGCFLSLLLSLIQILADVTLEVPGEIIKVGRQG